MSVFPPPTVFLCTKTKEHRHCNTSVYCVCLLQNQRTPSRSDTIRSDRTILTATVLIQKLECSTYAQRPAAA